MRTVSLRAVVLLLVVVPAGACLSNDYTNDPDAGRTVGANVTTYDVDASGTQQCPGGLFNTATQQMAVCTRANERCQSNAEGSGQMPIVCTCDVGTGNARWSCSAR